VAHRLLRPTILPGTSIELLWQTDPLLAAVFTDRDAMPVTSEIPSVGRDHLDALRRAIALIEAHEPEYAELMHAALRRIFVFQHPNVNCFASLNAHGVVCFNALDRDDEVFFVDELVHQVGHVIFSAMTTRRRDFFVVDPDLTIEQLGLRSRRGELRNVYTMLHGLYTEHMMVRCLRKLDERQVFSGRQAHELRGRLAFIARKRQIDVANLSQPGICSPLGERLVALFCGASHRLERERPDLFRIDLRGQPYNFSYDLYVRSNPPDRNELV
jgi:HEXXH motif-containing protein